MQHATAPLFLGVPQVEESVDHFVIRYTIDEEKFSSVFSSVATSSVLLLGIPATSDSASSPAQLPHLIAIVHLNAPVNPDSTDAKLEGNTLLLTLAKDQQQTC